MSRSQRRRGRGALCERGASVCRESEGQERLDREQVAVMVCVCGRLRCCLCHVSPDVHGSPWPELALCGVGVATGIQLTVV